MVRTSKQHHCADDDVADVGDMGYSFCFGMPRKKSLVHFRKNL